MKNKFNIQIYIDIDYYIIKSRSFIYHRNIRLFDIIGLYKSRIINHNNFGIQLKINNNEKE